MFGLFKNDPVKKLEKKYAKMLDEAKDVQRSGDLKKYARLIEEAEKVADEIATLRKEQG